jgi:hypothetical protein
MTNHKKIWMIALLAAMPTIPLTAALASAWTIMPAKTAASVAKGGLTVTPLNAWNRSSLRPSRRGEAWTRDGIALNELTFFAGIKDGEAILRQGYTTGKPLPKFKEDMLPTDIVQLFEVTSRALLQSSVFQVELTEPAKLGSHAGVRFRYNYAVQNEDLPRRGEAVGAIVEGKLYLVNFVAPSLYFFDRDIDEVRHIVAETKIHPNIAVAAANGDAGVN